MVGIDLYIIVNIYNIKSINYLTWLWSVLMQNNGTLFMIAIEPKKYFTDRLKTRVKIIVVQMHFPNGIRFSVINKTSK